MTLAMLQEQIDELRARIKILEARGMNPIDHRVGPPRLT